MISTPICWARPALFVTYASRRDGPDFGAVASSGPCGNVGSLGHPNTSVSRH